MARWKLTAAHYLNVPGTVWEYSEVDRTTGRRKRTQFPVPTLLDPVQPSDWSHRFNEDEGEIIVCLQGKGEAKDIEFLGDPTPDMVPIDDEAKAISARFIKKWNHPIDSLPGSFSDHLLEGFQAELAAVQSAQAQAAAAPAQGMTELLTAMTAMMKQNQELIAAIAGRTVVEAAPSAAPAPAKPAMRRA